MEIVYRHFIIVLLLFFYLNDANIKNNFLQSITISHFFAIKYKNAFYYSRNKTKLFYPAHVDMQNYFLTFVQIQPQVALF